MVREYNPALVQITELKSSLIPIGAGQGGIALNKEIALNTHHHHRKEEDLVHERARIVAQTS